MRPGEFRDTPWLSPQQTAFFQSILRPEFVVFEYGAGGSTFWLAKQVKEVVSVETKPAWNAAVTAEVKRRGLTNVTLRDHWPESAGVMAHAFDLVFIDNGKGADRFWAFRDAFALLVKPGGWVVLDNIGKFGPTPEAWRAIRHLGEETIILGADSTPPAPLPKFRGLDTGFYHVPE